MALWDPVERPTRRTLTTRENKQLLTVFVLPGQEKDFLSDKFIERVTNEATDQYKSVRWRDRPL